jgi:hypothetical protein
MNDLENSSENISENLTEPPREEAVVPPDVESKPGRKTVRRRLTLVRPSEVTDIEDGRLFDKLLAKLQASYAPQNAHQEADVQTIARLRWSNERLEVCERAAMNDKLRGPLRNIQVDPEKRLLLAVSLCAIDDAFLEIKKHQYANLRAINSMAARMERWHSSSKGASKPRG